MNDTNWTLSFKYENADIDNKNRIKEILANNGYEFKEIEDGNGIHLQLNFNDYNDVRNLLYSSELGQKNEIKKLNRYFKIDENGININTIKDIMTYDNYTKVIATCDTYELENNKNGKLFFVDYIMGLPYEKPVFNIRELNGNDEGQYNPNDKGEDITYKLSKDTKCQILQELHNAIKNQALKENTKEYEKETLLSSLRKYEEDLTLEDEIQKRKYEAKRINDILIKHLPDNLEEIQNLYDKSNIISTEWGNSYKAYDEFKKGFKELCKKYNIDEEVYDDKYFYDKDYREKRLAINGENIGAELKDIIKRLNQYENIDIDKIINNEQLQYIINSKENSGIETYKIPNRDKMHEKYIDEYLNNIKSISGELDKNGKVLYNGSIKNGKQVNIVIGYPASGKSTISNQISNLSQSRIVDSDEVKKLLPEYCNGLGIEKIHEESKDIMRKILDECIKNNENIVLPIVGAKPQSLERYLRQFTNAGYDIRLTLVNLPKQKCMARNLMRYIETGRLIHPNVLNDYTNPKDTLELVKNAINELGDNYKYNIKFIHEYNNDVPYGHKPELFKCYKVSKSIQDITQVAKMQYNQQNKQYTENQTKALKLK